ncbi:Zf-MYND domain containing protein [Mycena venus]|uniref:Zf-MYND domain containing protein n=1 Tax=Mycena venus TaxID=2733690 RepID=A0A8H7CP03_9AGAR|nr:Zf-MYND domain containing protein [Mycena venus]
MHATRDQGLDVNNQPHKITEGEYELYHNISPKLPINLCMARLVGVDPKRPGQRPLWRGDVVVVKRAEWPEPIPMGAGAHMDYLDFPPQAIELVSQFLLKWYNSDQWRDFFRTEREFNDSLLKMEQTWPSMKKLYQLPDNIPSGFDQKKHDKTSRLIDRLVAKERKNVERQELDKTTVCGHCKVSGASTDQPLRLCSGCRIERYCSITCQKLAWKEHKTICKAAHKDGA